MEEFLFYSGIGLMLCASAGAVITIMVSCIFKKRLEAQLDREYGAKQEQ